jgi:crossover junction endodeoxyribonuclease RusA
MEFIVPGTPRSANAGNRSRRRWREQVAQAAREALAAQYTSAEQDFSLLIIYFYRGTGSLDVDNIGKPLIDALKGLAFTDDKQISEVRIRKTRLRLGLTLTGASPYLSRAFARMSVEDTDFVYVRIDPAPDHGRIP